MFENQLPSAEEFMRVALGLTESETKKAGPKLPPVPEEIKRESLAVKAAQAQNSAVRKISEEMQGLLIQYCASCIAAYELSEVDFEPLAKRLGTRVTHLIEAANVADQAGEFWIQVMTERVRRVGAARVFRDVTWERVEGRALKMLDMLLEKNLIRDTGELLAVANQARKVSDSVPGQGQNPHGNQQGPTVNINFGGTDMGDGLPASGAKMTIDLSPRLATSLASRDERPLGGNRVIDSTMLSAKELREVLARQQAELSASNQES